MKDRRRSEKGEVDGTRRIIIRSFDRDYRRG